MNGWIRHGETKLSGGKRLTGEDMVTTLDGRLHEDSSRFLILTTPKFYENYVEKVTELSANLNG